MQEIKSTTPRQHLVIDLETLGTSPDAVILEIAAVRVTGDGDVIADYPFQQDIDPASCEAVGMRCDSATAMWWLSQSDEARSRLTKDCYRAPIARTLSIFTNWSEIYGKDDTLVWARGPEFDLSILAHAYELCGLKAPWRYYTAQSLRTLDLAIRAEGLDIERPTPAVKHSALDDAMADAQYLAAYIRRHKKC